MKAVILANGKFPEHRIPLETLRNAETIVCCDGATVKLVEFGLEPTAIVGDMDSLPEELRTKYADRLFPDPDQNTNDLTKAVKWCKTKNFNEIVILGATGLREDHTLGNIGLLISYAQMGLSAVMVTDFGIFTPILRSTTFNSYKGQPVSIFSQNHLTNISTKNLEFPISNRTLSELWMGTLNRSLNEWFEVNFTSGSATIFQGH